jgi:hypothetical protein
MQQPAARPRQLFRIIPVVALVAFLSGCTRFEDHASLTSNKRQEWTLSWTTLARRGINLVDSSGNVGSASASFPCQPDPGRPLTWTVDGPATHWSASGAAQDVLGPKTRKIWRGTVTLEKTAAGHALLLDLHDETGRAFAGNRRFATAQGNGESWYAQ